MLLKMVLEQKNQEQQTKPGQNSQGAGCNVKLAGGGCGGCKPNK